jgi:hypothetical protein
VCERTTGWLSYTLDPAEMESWQSPTPQAGGGPRSQVRPLSRCERVEKTGHTVDEGAEYRLAWFIDEIRLYVEDNPMERFGTIVGVVDRML